MLVKIIASLARIIFLHPDKIAKERVNSQLAGREVHEDNEALASLTD